MGRGWGGDDAQVLPFGLGAFLPCLTGGQLQISFRSYCWVGRACGFEDTKHCDVLMPGMQNFPEGGFSASGLQGCACVRQQLLACCVAKTRWKVHGLGATCCSASSEAKPPWLAAKLLS